MGFAPAVSHAFTATVTGAVVELAYEEPTVNTNGSALVDLDHTTIYYDMGSGPVEAMQVPASAPTGGATILQAVSVPVVDGQEADVTFWATASDASENESDPSNTATERIDRLAPGAPN